MPSLAGFRTRNDLEAGLARNNFRSSVLRTCSKALVKSLGLGVHTAPSTGFTLCKRSRCVGLEALNEGS